MNADNTMEVFQWRFSHSQEYPPHKHNVTALEMSGYSGFQKDCGLFIYYGWEFERDKGTEFKANKNCCFGFFFTHPLSLYSIFPSEIIIFVRSFLLEPWGLYCFCLIF